MTVTELLEAIGAAVPPGDRDTTEVVFDVTVGRFPSGEEGAEDWIMSSDLESIEFLDGSNHKRRGLFINVGYS